jgi:hypothetical protein
MSFDHFVRRLHLYLALALLPWFFIYGISSIPFSHNSYFEGRFRASGKPLWNLRSERTYELPMSPDGDLREIGAQIMRDAGLTGSFGASRPRKDVINLYIYTFRSASQAAYFIDQKRLRIEDRTFRWDHFLTGMHARGGFENPTPLSVAWAILVDIVCVGFLLWIATGIYMWWKLKHTRRWGWVALGSGALLFALFLSAL